MKKLVAGMICLMLTISLTACGGGSKITEPDESTTYEWKAANVLAAAAPWDLGLNEFARILNEKSDGRITLTVYSGGQLGGERDTMEGLQMGTVDFVIGSSATLSNFTDSNKIWDLPYLFLSKDAARNVLDGEIGNEVLGTLSDIGIKGLTYWENGMYAIGSKTPVAGAEDLKNMKIRAIESPLQADTYSCFGATAVVIAWGDIYTSLQQGVCDAVSSTTTPNMYSAKFYEVAPYIVETNHAYSPAPLLMSQVLWDSLPEDIQSIVMESAQEARAFEREKIDEALESCRAEMEAAGTTFTSIDEKEFAELVSPIYNKYVGADGIDPDLVERVKAEAEKYY